MNRFAVCIVAKHLGAVTHALAQPDEEAVTKALRRLAGDDECLMGGELRMSETLFRGGIYRALYLRQFGRISPGTGAAIASAKDPSGEDPRNDPDFGDCVVRLSPDAVRELVVANAATTKANQAIAALRPTLADCLPPGVQVNFTPAGLQGMLAEALYDRTVDQTDAPKKDPGQ